MPARNVTEASVAVPILDQLFCLTLSIVVLFTRRAAGKYKQNGKTYEVQPMDIIEFKFNVTAAPKVAKK
jgi:hypothetical protein